ncbi:hypothetical protein ACFV5N_22965 [Streptomyces sp. NPDC059853]|uniref:hypothetical protein n=1 Tax=Streptomyces sp. NPDC059853 TaxID=3346973 RepID=UPI00364C42C0
MTNGTTTGESAAELRRRAEKLRECAREARRVAGVLDSYLSTAVTTAQSSDPPLWKGPYAETTTEELAELQGSLRGMSEALTDDARRWDSAAARLDERADEEGE